MFHFIVLHRYWCFCCFFFFFLTHWRFVATQWWASLSANFLTVLSHFVSLYYILVIIAIFQTFSLLYFYGDLWLVIFDVTIVIVLGCHELHPYKMVNLTSNCCVFWLLYQPSVPLACSLSLGLSILWDTAILKLGQLITLQWSLECSRERKSHISHFQSKARND